MCRELHDRSSRLGRSDDGGVVPPPGYAADVATCARSQPSDFLRGGLSPVFHGMHPASQLPGSAMDQVEPATTRPDGAVTAESIGHRQRLGERGWHWLTRRRGSKRRHIVCPVVCPGGIPAGRGQRAYASITSHVRPSMHPVWRRRPPPGPLISWLWPSLAEAVRRRIARRSNTARMRPSRALPAGRGIGTTPHNGNLFLRGPLS
jgi:hypothetical protein